MLPFQQFNKPHKRAKPGTSHWSSNNSPPVRTEQLASLLAHILALEGFSTEKEHNGAKSRND
jgi:hypothetical protein